MHGHAPVCLPVNCRRRSDWYLRPRGDGRFDFGAVVLVTRAAAVRSKRGRPGGRGHDVDGGRGRGGVVVDGRRGGDGRGVVVVAQLLPETVLHVFVIERRRVADFVLENTWNKYNAVRSGTKILPCINAISFHYYHDFYNILMSMLLSKC